MELEKGLLKQVVLHCTTECWLAEIRTICHTFIKKTNEKKNKYSKDL